MKPHVRRVTAYIAARLILREDFGSIYDLATGQNYSVGGTADDATVDVYDYSCSCHISGSNSGSKYSLFHFGESAHITLILVSHKFKGFDFGSGSDFDGGVSGRAIQLYDSRDGQFNRFSV